MPFKSAAQRRLLYAKEPEVAKEFARKEEEARMTPSSFSKPPERPTGTTTSPTPKKRQKSEPLVGIMKPDALKKAAKRRIRRNGNSNSSTTSGY